MRGSERLNLLECFLLCFLLAGLVGLVPPPGPGMEMRLDLIFLAGRKWDLEVTVVQVWLVWMKGKIIKFPGLVRLWQIIKWMRHDFRFNFSLTFNFVFYLVEWDRYEKSLPSHRFPFPSRKGRKKGKKVESGKVKEGVFCLCLSAPSSSNPEKWKGKHYQRERSFIKTNLKSTLPCLPSFLIMILYIYFSTTGFNWILIGFPTLLDLGSKVDSSLQLSHSCNALLLLLSLPRERESGGGHWDESSSSSYNFSHTLNETRTNSIDLTNKYLSGRRLSPSPSIIHSHAQATNYGTRLLSFIPFFRGKLVFLQDENIMRMNKSV